jgi:hypothetical protein
MKHLLSGVALAALLTAGLPAIAQTGSGTAKPAAAQSGTTATGAKSSTAADTDSARSGASTSPESTGTSSNSAGTGAKHRASPSDNMAEQLNREELQRVENGGQASGSSQSPAPTGTTSAGGN